MWKFFGTALFPQTFRRFTQNFRKLWVSRKFACQEIRWSCSILCSNVNHELVYHNSTFDEFPVLCFWVSLSCHNHAKELNQCVHYRKSLTGSEKLILILLNLCINGLLSQVDLFYYSICLKKAWYDKWYL